jgi:hypothetical protein
MGGDLRQEELGIEVAAGEEARLGFRIGVRVGPAAQRQPRRVPPDGLAQLPGVLHAAGRPHRSVAAEDHERRKPFVDCPFRVAQAELHRVLGREEGHDVAARDVAAEVDEQVPQVVLLARADGAVGQEHEPVVVHETAHRVVRVDPRVHARRRVELGARRPQLGRQHAACAAQRVYQ